MAATGSRGSAVHGRRRTRSCAHVSRPRQPSPAAKLKHLEPHARESSLDERQPTRGLARQIDDALARRIWASIVDAHEHPIAAAHQHYAHDRTEGQRAMRGRVGSRIVELAIGRRATGEAIRILAGDPALY